MRSKKPYICSCLYFLYNLYSYKLPEITLLGKNTGNAMS